MASLLSGLESLPLELLTLISNRLSLPDLKRFRMVCTTTAEAVFERMVALMPRTMTVHGKRASSLLDLRFLGQTFKMGAAIARLGIVGLRPEYGDLLARVRLPALRELVFRGGKVAREEDLVSILKNHRQSLEEVRLEDVMIVLPKHVILWDETKSWRRVLGNLEEREGLRLKRLVVRGVGYCSEDGSVERYLRRRWEGDAGSGEAGAESVEVLLASYWGKERLKDFERFKPPYWWA